MKKLIWLIWIVVISALAGYFSYTLFLAEDKSQFLIGEATHGHHQIELACDTCHTDAFGGGEVLQNACLTCHKDELKESQDSHPAKKFNDPRNADLLEVVDARYCISCHTEHQKEQTHEMGLTLPKDYCFHCHEEIGEERESHKDLAFDSCASAGCHNYHDNRALYENFLIKHTEEPWLKDIAEISAAGMAKWKLPTQKKLIEKFSGDFKQQTTAHPDIASVHADSAHGEAGLSCGGCHQQEEEWVEKPGLAQCKTCHADEAEGFTSGKHGMRLSDKLAQPLTPMTPALAANPTNFHAESMQTEQGCNTCHSAHDFNTKTAAVEKCLTCHADEHSTSFADSPHGKTWDKALKGEISETEAVTCATCHMPKIETKKNGEIVMRVEHNQNANLRPNEKMIRPVCMQCHSLEFSIDALADPALIQNNFGGKPEVHIESIDWAKRRE